MRIVTVCEILNQVDNKNYTLYLECVNAYFKVVLLESTILPLGGKMDINDISYFCAELGKTCEEYLIETKNILCGKNSETQFFIDGKTLQWKRNMWTLGKIELHSILDIKIISDSFQQLIKTYQTVQNKIIKLEEENKNIMDANKELCTKIEKMIEIKMTMEQDLYKKFIMLLNSKKQKIRELESNIKNQSNEESVFNAPTDESEESGKEEETWNLKLKASNKAKKRKSLDYNTTGIQKNKKAIDSNTDQMIHRASGSKDYGQIKNNSTIEEKGCDIENRKSKSNLSFSQEESEEELFSE